MAYDNRNRFNYESSAYDFSAFEDYDVSSYEVHRQKSNINFELFDQRRTKAAAKERGEGRTGTAQNRKKRVSEPVRTARDSKAKGNVRTAAPVTKRQQAAANFAKAEVDKKALVRRIAICAAAAATITMLIVSQVHSHELTRSIEKTQKDLVELQQEYDIMLDKFNMEMSDSAVEKYASERLGMQKAESGQTEYVSLGSDEHFEFGAEDRSSWTRS